MSASPGFAMGSFLRVRHLFWLVLVALGPMPLLGAPQDPSDPLPEGAVRRLGSLRFRQGGRVTSVAISPDGQRALSTSSNSTVTVWDLDTGRRLKTLEGHRSESCTVAFAPDGRTALSSSHDGTLILWDCQTWKAIRTLSTDEQVHGVAISPSSDRAVSGEDEGRITLWDLKTGEVIRRMEGPTIMTHGVAFHPKGHQILSASYDHSVRLWDVESGKELRTFPGHTDIVLSVCFSPDGRTALSAGADHQLILWDVETGKALRKIASGVWSPFGPAFSPDGKSIIAGGTDYAVTRWDVATGEKLSEFKGHRDHPYGMAFTPDGKRLLSGGMDRTLILWDVATGRRVHPLEGHPTQVLSVAWNGSGDRLFSASYDGTIALWDTKNGRMVSTAPGPGPGMERAVLGPDGMTAFKAGADQFVEIWDLATMKREGGHANASPVLALAVTHDGQTVLTNGSGGDLILRDVVSGETLRILQHQEPPDAACFSPDDRLVASGGKDGRVLVWASTDAKILHSLRSNEFMIRQVAFSPDGRFLLAASADGSVVLWNVETGENLRTFEGHRDGVGALAFTPDGQYAVSGSFDKTAVLWDLRSGNQLRVFRGHVGAIQSVAISPGGTHLATGSTDSTILLWPLAGTSPENLAPWQKTWTSMGKPERQAAAAELMADFADSEFDRWARAQSRLSALGEEGLALLAGAYGPESSSAAPAEAKCAALLASLDDDDPAVREKGWQGLRAFGRSIEGWVKGKLKRPLDLSPEAREGLERLEHALEQEPLSSTELGKLRAVAYLIDHLPLEAAKELLRRYAKGPLEAHAVALARCAVLGFEDTRSMAKISLQQSERAEEAEDYSVAIALAGEARLLAARAGDLTLKKDAEDRLRALKPARAAYENALDSHRKLSKNPQDAAAHLALGKYHAFVRRAWTKGLDLMAKGGDSSLQALARQDLASPKDPGIQFDLAEAWLACAEKSVDRLEKNAARDRARYWGERASPGLTGERGRKLQARLDALITGDLPGSHVDLLALIDLRKDVVHGEWAVENGSLVCRKSSPSARVQIPYLPPDEYEVEVVLTRLEGKEAANIGLARGESQFHVVIDGWPEDGFRSGLSMVDGKLADQNPTTRKGLLLTNGKASTVRCRVTKEGVSATLDGQPFFEWKGEFSRLSPFHILKVPNPKALSLVSYDCQFQFIKAVLTPVSGEGRRLR